MRFLSLPLFIALSLAAQADLPRYDTSRARPLELWKKQIKEYSRRHYGEAEWALKPRCIVLHYTAGTTFPWNLVKTGEFAGETPGLASHYVIDGSKVFQLLPPTVRSRAAYGINHRAINIEMVGANADDMARRTPTLDAASELVLALMEEFDIPATEIYSHEDVAKMDTKIVPWVLDKVNSAPYHKLDPGPASMQYVLKRVKAKAR